MVNFGSPTKLSGKDKAISTEQLAALAARTPRGDASTQLRRNASAKEINGVALPGSPFEPPADGSLLKIVYHRAGGQLTASSSRRKSSSRMNEGNGDILTWSDSVPPERPSTSSSRVAPATPVQSEPIRTLAPQTPGSKRRPTTAEGAAGTPSRLLHDKDFFCYGGTRRVLRQSSLETTAPATASKSVEEAVRSSGSLSQRNLYRSLYSSTARGPQQLIRKRSNASDQSWHTTTPPYGTDDQVKQPGAAAASPQDGYLANPLKDKPNGSPGTPRRVVVAPKNGAGATTITAKEAVVAAVAMNGNGGGSTAAAATPAKASSSAAVERHRAAEIAAGYRVLSPKMKPPPPSRTKSSYDPIMRSY